MLAKRFSAGILTNQSISDAQIDESSRRIYLGWCLSEADLNRAIDLLRPTRIEVRRTELAQAYGKVAGGVIELASIKDAVNAFDTIIAAGLAASLPVESRIETVAAPDEPIATPSLAYLPKVS